MVEVLEDLQPLLDDAVRLLALDVGDEADAAGIVLVARVVQAAGGGCGQLLAGVAAADAALAGPTGRQRLAASEAALIISLPIVDMASV